MLYHAHGCSHCDETGYRGRVALYEVMQLEGEVVRKIDASTEEILETAVAQGMKTLREDGQRLPIEGISSLAEIRRVTGDFGF